MRVAVIHIGQETDTFNPRHTDLAECESIRSFPGWPASADASIAALTKTFAASVCPGPFFPSTGDVVAHMSTADVRRTIRR